MTNIIGYNKLPNKDEFIELYVNQKKLQSELAEIYGCGKLRIRQWIKKFDLNLRPRGAGNNTRFFIEEKTLRKLVDDKNTNDEISEILGMSKSNVCKLLKQYGIKREIRKSEYQKYARKVRVLSEKNYVKYKEIINPNNYPRTLCGVEGGYQLDHILSVRESFDKGLKIEDCANVKNLQMLPWRHNLEKRKIKGRQK